MTKMHPENPDKFASEAEEKTFNLIKEKLPDEYTAYYNYRINGNEFDFAILVPEKGIVIIEVKGHFEKNIVRVIDNTRIKLRGTETLKSPMKQALRYRNCFFDAMDRKFGYEKLKNEVPIVPMVCYPNISKNFFYEKGLYEISEEEETIFREEFNSGQTIIKKIDLLLEKKKSELYINHVSNLSLKKVKSLLEKVDLKINKKEKIENCYSILRYIENNENYKNIINESIDLWGKGSKVIIFYDSDSILNYILKCIKKKKEEIYISNIDIEDFNFFDENGNIKEQIYNLNLYKTNKLNNEYKELFILDGKEEDISKYKEILNKLDSETNFNLNQYKLEHAPIGRDIIVKAGAGTGKTYSMISRIMFLIYKQNIEAEDLKDSIILITFTREAAKNMKIKLKERLKNRYMITKDLSTIKMIESVDEMNICTIHSLSKKIIKNFATVLGLGNNPSIINSKYRIDKIVADNIDEYIELNKEKIEKNIEFNKISFFYLKKCILRILEKLSNKNIDFGKDNIDIGKIEIEKIKEIEELIFKVAKKSKYESRKINEEENSIGLSDLILSLNNVIEENYKLIEKSNSKLKYVFVDEFQDTDDVQINLLKNFQDINNFNIFIVGDIKQCIYRFRGADDRAFDVIKRNNENQFLEYSLIKNYRSDYRLLKKFHEIFNSWGKRSLIEYKADDKIIGVKKIGLEDKKIYRLDVYDDNDIEEKLVLEIRNIKKEIEKNNEKKKTIAILVRYNSDIEKIKSMLNNSKYNDIDVETDIGGELYRIRPTLDLYKLTLALEYFKDPKYLYNLYTTSYVSKRLDKYELYKLKNNKEKLVELYNKKYYLSNWKEYISRLKSEPVMKVLRDIINDLEPWNNYTDNIENIDIKKRKTFYYRTNLEQIIEKIITSCNNEYLTLNKLNKFLEIMILTKQDEEVRDSYSNLHDIDSQKIRILCMTVHKAKGLEFDEVIMPFCSFPMELDTKSNNKNRREYVNLVVDDNKLGYKINIPYMGGEGSLIVENNYYKKYENKEKEDTKKEEARILYVAMTRAKNKFIYFNNNKINKSKNTLCWQKIIEE